jgi:DNA-binding CsgD family transcriptional regulator
MISRETQGEAAAVLFSRFGLTPAEARIALGIAHGDSLATIAKEHGVSVKTARTQLKAVFAKTATHRQAELAALLLKMHL